MSIRVGLVGLGWWGQQLFGFFNQVSGARIDAICSSKADSFSSDPRYANVQFYRDLDQMLNGEDLDALVIATPPPFHKEATIKAARNKIHVFCEKPMAATVADCNEMIASCSENEVILMVAYKHRFAQAFSMLKERSGIFGPPLWAMYTYPLWKVDDPGWKFQRNGTGGIIMENVVHAIDAMSYLMDSEVLSVSAEGNSVVFGHDDIPDSTVFTLRFRNGAIAAIGGGCTSDQNVSREYLDIHYENGIGQISGTLDWPKDLRIFDRRTGKISNFTFDNNDGVKEEITHFIECIRTDNLNTMSGGHSGRHATQVAAAVLESIRSDKKIYL